MFSMRIYIGQRATNWCLRFYYYYQLMGIQQCKHEHKQRPRYEVTHDINLATSKFEHRIRSRNMCLVRDAIVQCFYIYTGRRRSRNRLLRRHGSKACRQIKEKLQVRYMKKVARQGISHATDVWPNDGRNKFESYKTSFGTWQLSDSSNPKFIDCKGAEPFYAQQFLRKRKCPSKMMRSKNLPSKGIFVKLDAT